MSSIAPKENIFGGAGAQGPELYFLYSEYLAPRDRKDGPFGAIEDTPYPPLRI